MSRLCPAAFTLGLLAVLASPLPGAEVQHWRYEGTSELLAADIDGVSVDSFGRVRLAPEARALAPLDAAYVWALVAARDGDIFVATGDDGRVFRVGAAEAKAEVYFDSPEAHVYALTQGPDGRLYAGTSPDGRVYAIDEGGRATPFFDPDERYIWALRFDAHGDLWVACGGPARLYRVRPDGTAAALLTTPEAHVTALEIGPTGNVFAGTSPGGILYRVDRQGQATSLADSPFKEVRAIVAQADGSLLAAVVMEAAKERDETRAIAGTLPAGEVTVTESVTAIGGVVPQGQPAPVAPSAPTVAQPPLAKGAVLRIGADGASRTVWSSAEDMPLAMAAVGEAGDVWVATGPRARLFRIREDRLWELVAALPCEQATALARTRAGGALIGTSNAGRVYALGREPGPRGRLTLKVRDAQTVSRWGRISWEGDGPRESGVVFETRSGNSGTPDEGWSDWVAASFDPGGAARIASPPARFLQIRLQLRGEAGRAPVVHSLAAAFLQPNLPPLVTDVIVYAPGEVFQKVQAAATDGEILGLAPEESLPQSRPPGSSIAAPLAVPGPFNKRLYMRGLQTFSWSAVDPNGDDLLFDVEYRAAGASTYQPLRRGLREGLLTWDTAVLPNGRYAVRVRARDDPSNPRALALVDDLEGGFFQVDNSPPAIRVDRVPGTRGLRVTVRDQDSPVRRLDFALAGQTWEELRPVDGLADSPTEVYELESVLPQGDGRPELIMLRALDGMGNVASETARTR